MKGLKIICLTEKGEDALKSFTSEFDKKGLVERFKGKKVANAVWDISESFNPYCLIFILRDKYILFAPQTIDKQKIVIDKLMMEKGVSKFDYEVEIL